MRSIMEMEGEQDQKFQPSLINPYNFTVTKQSFVFPQFLENVVYFQRMLENTCCILHQKTNKKYYLSHYDKNGKKLKSYLINYQFFSVNLLSVISDREVIWADLDEDKIFYWNLQSYQFFSISFFFTSNGFGSPISINYFPFTNLISIIEPGFEDNNLLRISYFSLPLGPSSTPLYIYQSDQVWNYQCKIMIGNAKSMIIWCDMKKNLGSLSFKSLQLQFGSDESCQAVLTQYTQIKIEDFIDDKKSQNILVSIWQMNPNNYFIYLRSHVQQSELKNYVFVYQSNQKKLRIANFQQQMNDQYKILITQNNGQTSVLYTIQAEEGQFKESPIYYIDNLTESIIRKEQWVFNPNFKYSNIINHDFYCFEYQTYDHKNTYMVNSVTTRIDLNVPNVPWRLLAAKTVEDIIGHNCDVALIEQACQMVAGQKERYQNQLRQYYCMELRSKKQ